MATYGKSPKFRIDESAAAVVCTLTNGKLQVTMPDGTQRTRNTRTEIETYVDWWCARNHSFAFIVDATTREEN